MDSKFLLTVGDVSNLEGLFNGPYLKGQSEPRIVVVGRSNVGKSSLLNELLGKSLARTSAQPGKTRAIHFYLWKKAGKILADLPGYGYARASKEERMRWEKFIDAYFKKETCLERALVLLDSRHGPTASDIEAIEFLSSENIPVTFIMTKFDTVKTQSERAKRKKEVATIMARLGYGENPLYWISVKTKLGLKELTQDLNKHSKDYG